MVLSVVVNPVIPVWIAVNPSGSVVGGTAGHAPDIRYKVYVRVGFAAALGEAAHLNGCEPVWACNVPANTRSNAMGRSLFIFPP
jgi:hypothetical protein